MDLLRELHPQAVRIADMLKARGEKIAVADGATGGLIAASLLTVPGALKFYVGGGIVYSFKARDVLFDLPRDAYEGMRSVTEEYAVLQARAIRRRLGADWGIAESGSAGASKHPMGVASGRSIAAICGPDTQKSAITETAIRETSTVQTAIIETGSDDRIDNMAAFTRNAITLLETALSDAA